MAKAQRDPRLQECFNAYGRVFIVHVFPVRNGDRKPGWYWTDGETDRIVGPFKRADEAKLAAVASVCDPGPWQRSGEWFQAVCRPSQAWIDAWDGRGRKPG